MEENKNIYLDNEVVDSEKLKEAFNNLKKNQRIVEAGEDKFYTVERFYD